MCQLDKDDDGRLLPSTRRSHTLLSYSSRALPLRWRLSGFSLTEFHLYTWIDFYASMSHPSTTSINNNQNQNRHWDGWCPFRERQTLCLKRWFRIPECPWFNYSGRSISSLFWSSAVNILVFAVWLPLLQRNVEFWIILKVPNQFAGRQTAEDMSLLAYNRALKLSNPGFFFVFFNTSFPHCGEVNQ